MSRRAWFSRIGACAAALVAVSSCSSGLDLPREGSGAVEDARAAAGPAWSYRMDACIDLAGGPDPTKKSVYAIRGDAMQRTYWMERWIERAGGPDVVVPFSIDTFPTKEGGQPVRMAVSAVSATSSIPTIFFVTDLGKLYWLQTSPWSGTWQPMKFNLLAKDIACTASTRSPWIITADGRSVYILDYPAGNGIWHKAFPPPPGSDVLVAIDVIRREDYLDGLEARGLPWVVDARGRIWEMVPSGGDYAWIERSGGFRARHVGIGKDFGEQPSVYMVGGYGRIGTDIYRWDHAASRWILLAKASAERVDVDDTDGSAYYIDARGRLHFPYSAGGSVDDWAFVLDSCDDAAPSPADEDVTFALRSTSYDEDLYDSYQWIDRYDKGRGTVELAGAKPHYVVGNPRRLDVGLDAWGREQPWTVTDEGRVYRIWFDGASLGLWEDASRGSAGVDVSIAADGSAWILDAPGRNVLRRDAATGAWSKAYDVPRFGNGFRLAMAHHRGSSEANRPWIIAKDPDDWWANKVWEYLGPAGGWVDRTEGAGYALDVGSRKSASFGPGIALAGETGLYVRDFAAAAWRLAVAKPSIDAMMLTDGRAAAIFGREPITNDRPMGVLGLPQ